MRYHSNKLINPSTFNPLMVLFTTKQFQWIQQTGPSLFNHLTTTTTPHLTLPSRLILHQRPQHSTLILHKSEVVTIITPASKSLFPLTHQPITPTTIFSQIVHLVSTLIALQMLPRKHPCSHLLKIPLLLQIHLLAWEVRPHPCLIFPSKDNPHLQWIAIICLILIAQIPLLLVTANRSRC